MLIQCEKLVLILTKFVWRLNVNLINFENVLLGICHLMIIVYFAVDFGA